MRRVRSHVIGADDTLGEVQGLRRAVRAELLGTGRRALRVKPPWQREPLRYEAEDRRAVIDAEATEAEFGARSPSNCGMRTVPGASSSRG
jgi:hypothetical protein